MRGQSSRFINYRSVAFWLLVALVASIPSENGVTIPGIGSLAKLIGMLAFAATAVSLFDRGQFRIRPPSMFLVLALLFTLWNMASYFWSWSPLRTISELVTLVQLFALAWLVWQLCTNRRETALLLQAFVLGCYVTIAVALTVLVTSAEPSFRNVGAFNPNGFAIVCSLAIPMAWLLAVQRLHGRLYWLNLLYPALAIIAVILSASRGGLLTLLVALAVIPLTQFRLSIWQRLTVLLLACVTVWAAFVQAPIVFPDLDRNLARLAGTTDELTTGTLTGRRQIWDAGMELFSSSPVIGIGVGSFNNAVQPIIGKAKGPHNAFLSVAVGLGVMGVLLFAGMLSSSALSTFLSSKRDRTFFVVLFTALLVGMAPTNSEHDKFVWFVLSVLATQSPVVIRTGGRQLSEVIESSENGVGLRGSGAR